MCKIYEMCGNNDNGGVITNDYSNNPCDKGETEISDANRILNNSTIKEIESIEFIDIDDLIGNE